MQHNIDSKTSISNLQKNTTFEKTGVKEVISNMYFRLQTFIWGNYQYFYWSCCLKLRDLGLDWMPWGLVYWKQRVHNLSHFTNIKHNIKVQLWLCFPNMYGTRAKAINISCAFGSTLEWLVWQKWRQRWLLAHSLLPIVFRDQFCQKLEELQNSSQF